MIYYYIYSKESTDTVIIYSYDSLQGCSNSSGNELMLNNNLSENLLDGLFIFIFSFNYIM